MSKKDLGLVTTTGEWLGLSREDELLNETKVEFVEMLREARTQNGLTQTDLAKRVGMLQPALARIEGGGPATLDVLFRCLIAVGVPPSEIAHGVVRAEAAITDERNAVARHRAEVAEKKATPHRAKGRAMRLVREKKMAA